MEQVASNGPERADMLAFVQSQTGRRPAVWQEADLLAACDLDGARAEAFMHAFGRTFGVDLAGYEAQFHHRAPARAARFGWPLPVQHRFGVRVPIPLSTLVTAAQTGHWPLRYPQLPSIPSRDWVNWLLVLVALPLGVALMFWALRGSF